MESLYISETSFINEIDSNPNESLDSFFRSSDSSIFTHSVGWTITFSVMYSIIFVIGLVGNFLVIIVIYKRRPLRNVTNAFLLNLAVADWLVIVLCVPSTLMSTIFTPWLFGSILCKSITFVQGVSVFASAYSLVAISVDRCLCTLRPNRRGQGFSYAQAKGSIIIIWLISFIAILPWLIVFQTVPADDIEDGPFCVEKWESKRYEKIYYGVINLGMGYFFPLIIISIVHFLIWWKLFRPMEAQNSQPIFSIPLTALHQKNKEEVKRMLKITTLTFILCWLPLHSVVTRIKLFDGFGISQGEMRFQNIFIPLAQLLGSLNSSINPIIYAFVNTKFRRSFWSIVKRFLCTNHINHDFGSPRLQQPGRTALICLDKKNIPLGSRTSTFYLSRRQPHRTEHNYQGNIRSAHITRRRGRRPQLNLYRYATRDIQNTAGAMV